MSTPGDLLEALGREARARLGGREREEGVHVFRGRSVEELIPQIERELGADALIVRRREGLTGGVLGFFQHAYVEIEAIAGASRVDVYDEPPPAAAPEPAPAQQFEPPPTLPPAQAAAAYAPPPPVQQTPPPVHQPPPPSYGFVPEPQAAPAEPGIAGSYVSPQLAALARAEPPPTVMPPRPAPPAGSGFDFGELFAGTPAPAPVRPPAPLAPPPAARQPLPAERRSVPPGSSSRVQARIERSLLRYGVSQDFARELIEQALAHTLPLAPRAGLAQAVQTTLARRIPVAPPLPLKGAAIVLVGPGGSGKTTVCAAMLGAYRAQSTVPAAFASLIAPGEGEQLQMLLSPQIVKPTAARSARAASALRKARREGLAILDTPPISPAERTRVRDLARLLGDLEPDRVVVALPATLGATAAEQLLSALAPLRANSLAVTHAEETDQIGVAVEAACRHGLAAEYTLERARPGGWLLRRVDPADLAGRMLP